MLQANPIDVLKGFVKRIEEGKMKGWIFVYPVTAVDSTKQFDVAYLCGGELSTDELRWIASKLIDKANSIDEVIEKWKKGEL